MFLFNKNYYYLNNEFYLIEGSTSFSRQHHSTNTLDEQHTIPPDYIFFVTRFLLFDFCFIKRFFFSRIIMYH
jgi:hypothetical protein